MRFPFLSLCFPMILFTETSCHTIDATFVIHQLATKATLYIYKQFKGEWYKFNLAFVNSLRLSGWDRNVETLSRRDCWKGKYKKTNLQDSLQNLKYPKKFNVRNRKKNQTTEIHCRSSRTNITPTTNIYIAKSIYTHKTF